MVEQEHSLCWSCLLAGFCAAWAFFRSVTDQTNDRWVTKKPTNATICLYLNGLVGEYTIPSDWRIANNKSTVWKLTLIVER